MDDNCCLFWKYCSFGYISMEISKPFQKSRLHACSFPLFTGYLYVRLRAGVFERLLNGCRTWLCNFLWRILYPGWRKFASVIAMSLNITCKWSHMYVKNKMQPFQEYINILQGSFWKDEEVWRNTASFLMLCWKDNLMLWNATMVNEFCVILSKEKSLSFWWLETIFPTPL